MARKSIVSRAMLGGAKVHQTIVCIAIVSIAGVSIAAEKRSNSKFSLGAWGLVAVILVWAWVLRGSANSSPLAAVVDARR